MGNVCSPSFSFSCDAAISRCLDFTVRKAGYICQLQDNLDNLETELGKLIEARNDVLIKVTVSEQQGMKRLEQVQGWVSRVQDVDAKSKELIRRRGQVEQLCLGGFCSKHCILTYKFGEKVFKTLRVVQNLRSERDFTEVAQTIPENPVDERPLAPTTVGLQSTFDKVWRCLTEEQAGIIGIYGMGGVGKTTLLTLINNKFLDFPNNFDFVIWAVVSKDLELEKIQESIAKKIGLFNESWKSKSLQEKAQEIFKFLSKKKFVLLLDDIWEPVDLTTVGLPLPSRTSTASKLIFTTREFEICGNMDAHKSFKVECLRYEDAWKLFEEKVGKEILDSHPNIPELAETVARECAGLPLALIVVGRAMACKKTHQEWEHAIEVLRSSASKFSGMQTRVYSRLKFSYDFLPSDTTRFCLLYCSLFPEDYRINTEDLIDCWICEGILDEYDGIGARNEGYSIIGTLSHASLLLEEEDGYVKMHDVIRDMALWIASTIDYEKEKEKFLVLAGVGITEAPRIGMWKDVTRMSLMNNKIGNLLGSPTCPNLRTLFLRGQYIDVIESDFFQYMTSLRVLDVVLNTWPSALPICNLVSLQHLDLSDSNIHVLPVELKCLVNLKCLKLERTTNVHRIPPKVISNLTMLRVLRMFRCGSTEQKEDSILFGNGEALVGELLCLKHINVLTITLKGLHALQEFLTSPVLQNSTRSLFLSKLEDVKSLSVSSPASLPRLEILHLWNCKDLKELKIEHAGEVKSILETHRFHSLQDVDISLCSELKHVTWLIFAQNLKKVQIKGCHSMEEIIKMDEIPAETVENLIPFERLQFLRLRHLENLKSIYSNPLPFPRLKELVVMECQELKKLPLDCNNASGRKFTIWGEERWWKELQWDDEATHSAFLPCFHESHELVRKRSKPVNYSQEEQYFLFE